jgi:HD-GYP domain-containing protein (c-di-GMP phosphodiesterase class II)
MTTPQKRAVPLQIVMGALFCLLVGLVGLIIGGFSYRESSKMLLTAGKAVFERADQQIRLSSDKLFLPIQGAVIQSSHLPALSHLDWQQRLAALPALASVLNNNSSVSSVYVGYHNGDFMQLRPLPDQSARQRWQAPESARYALDIIDRQQQPLRYQRMFFDLRHQQLASIPLTGKPLDPRQRPWFRQAQASNTLIVTDAYTYYLSGEAGITLAHPCASKGGVIGADLTLQQLDSELAGIPITPSTRKYLLDPQLRVLAGHTGTETTELPRSSKLAPLNDPVIATMREHARGLNTTHEASVDGRLWLGRASRIHIGQQDMWLVLASPEEELLHDAIHLRDQQMWLTLVILLVSMPLVWQASRWVSKPLEQLAEEARAIEAFDFSRPIERRSHIREINRLAQAMSQMKATISQFLDLSAALSSERQLQPLLQRVLQESASVIAARGCAIFLLGGKNRLHRAAAMADGEQLPTQLGGTDDELAVLCRQAMNSGKRIDNQETPDQAHVIVMPLATRQGDSVGAMVLQLDERDNPGRTSLGFIESLSGTAAISIEAQRLLEAQKRLLEAFIELIAGAIDAKSPYTGGHCQRVPALTKMLADAACQADSGPFRDFKLSDNEREALHLAAWLHDCGKVTTPEYVVDKATKLETIYDRIHEIRTRFEVLKRDAQIEYWKALASGAEQQPLANQLEQTLKTLDEEFRFIAECNLGGEFMAPEKQARLKHIGARTWQRTLDDRLGVSHEELARKASAPEIPLPATETLLGNKPEHLISRSEKDRIPGNNPWGFKLQVPQYKYNRGELYNLGIERGTLTDEERYQINDHIVQTIIMLSHLPFPPHLQQVPELAGGHHEKMDGNGYPKRLRREQMSTPARMMAIADIFEALTAIDRPYKQGKTLSQAIAIMARMRDEQHIDAELFALFLQSGVYAEYGSQFLQPAQIDEVDIQRYLHAT